MTLEKRSTLLTEKNKKKKGTKHSQEDGYSSNKNRNEEMQPIPGLASG